MMGKNVTKKATKIIRDLTEGVLSSAVDASLWFVAYLGTMSIPQSSVGQLYRAQRAADQFLDKVNYETIKRGIIEARRRGWLKAGKRGSRSWPVITEAGKRRLASLLPVYDEKRVWDGRMYLLAYDIPESKRNQRDILRDFARRIGCAKLQESVYITPYDPRGTLKDFVEEMHLFGTIIVSDIGKDGSIGDEDLQSLLVRVYQLEALSDRYEAWMRKAEERGIDRLMAIAYYSILKDDPQLPFALLPSWWNGDAAYQRVKPFLVYC